MYAIKHLREELNRERAWRMQYEVALSKNQYVTKKRRGENDKRVRENRIQSLCNALQALKPIKKKRNAKKEKPSYYFLNPKTTKI